MGLLALICLLAYGSLMLWAGFRIGTGGICLWRRFCTCPPAGLSAVCVSLGECFAVV